ncbi:hypothetical protein K1T71_014142 [Dendrolimus kikuchii]|uniref:Uncharacterized protein n=1 Tax=Dendrolimus kikuchii TaxID=765133 RepID=A0ACC1CFG2_9NEOP|nr:hypothetical protein K1T71_014142 [Dendrolimus kikuchii]
MLKNPLYIYGPKNVPVPSDLNFGSYILDSMWNHRDNVALIDGGTDEAITYKEIAQQSMNFAVSLTRMGVKKDDVVAIFSENRKEFWGAVIGVACAGAVLTPINTAYVGDEMRHVLKISKPKYMIISPAMYKTHEKMLRSIDCIKKFIVFGNERYPITFSYDALAIADGREMKDIKYENFMPVDVKGQTDTLLIVYSSGTTGLPKGVMLTHLNVILQCCMPSSHNPLEITITITPWYHVMGFVGLLAGLAVGRTGIYFAKFDLELYLRTIEKYKAVQLTVVPPVLIAACKFPKKYDLSSVRLIYSGAAPLHKDTINAVPERFPNVQAVLQGYGSSEATLALTRFSYDDYSICKTGSVGKVVPGAIVKIVDTKTRKPLGPNQQGEICAKGDVLMKGYVGKPRGDDFDDEGFYKTGDVGYYDEDGQFYITDRLKELIKYKAYQVPPAELEAVLLQHEAIKDAGVVGIEDKSAGEVPLAFVVLQPGKTASEQEIKDFIAERLSNPKHLRGGVRFLEQIPKTPSGKILRKDLKKLATTGRSKL